MSIQNRSEPVAPVRRRGAAGVRRTAEQADALGVLDLHRQLLETAFDLSQEFDEVPAGSVMRCFARAVHLARLDGASGSRLVDEARRIAVSALRERDDRGTSRRRPGLAATA
ncbi:hypothetical protein ACT8ZV_22675 [Nocardioides sp. MAHUQ-72]|uniref:hypothetical protein n=1 Tax=unclassified Nocardioides TaxID=2615069 RepID=UPI00360FE3ED